MTALLRLLIWLLAVSFAASPVVLSVASSPAHDKEIFNAASYVEYGRDVAFVIVALISIGMIDALEVIATLFGENPSRNWVASMAFVLMIVFIPLLVVAVHWAAPGLKTTPGDIKEILNFGMASLLCAFGARVVSLL